MILMCVDVLYSQIESILFLKRQNVLENILYAIMLLKQYLHA